MGFLTQKIPHFFIPKNFKTGAFWLSVNKIFHAKENIILLLFFIFYRVEGTTLPVSSKIQWKDHLSTNFLRWKKKISLPEKHNINFCFILKFIDSSFLFNLNNFPFVQSSYFYNNFFLSFFRTNLFLITILKGLIPF